MITPILAALAMFTQDMIAVPLVQAEAAYLAHRAAALDTIGYLVALMTTVISVTALQGHDTTKKVAVIVLVSIANYSGTYCGVQLGKRFRKPDEQITELERWKAHVISVYPDLMDKM